jgi:hypothetical protein
MDVLVQQFQQHLTQADAPRRPHVQQIFFHFFLVCETGQPLFKQVAVRSRCFFEKAGVSPKPRKPNKKRATRPVVLKMETKEASIKQQTSSDQPEKTLLPFLKKCPVASCGCEGKQVEQWFHMAFSSLICENGHCWWPYSADAVIDPLNSHWGFTRFYGIEDNKAGVALLDEKKVDPELRKPKNKKKQKSPLLRRDAEGLLLFERVPDLLTAYKLAYMTVAVGMEYRDKEAASRGLSFYTHQNEAFVFDMDPDDFRAWLEKQFSVPE